MSLDLLDYLSQRYYGRKEESKSMGPFLTISRETGCSGTGLASELVKAFRKMGMQWRFLNREILDKADEKLHIGRNKLEHDFIIAKGTAMDDVVKALSSRYYKKDQKVRDTVAAIIQHEAREGRTIIVSSAGAVTTAGIPGGLHIRLIAPFDWRIKALSKHTMLSESEIETFIVKNDKKRNFILEQFTGKGISELYFDLIINMAVFSHSQAIEVILNAMLAKGFL